MFSWRTMIPAGCAALLLLSCAPSKSVLATMGGEDVPLEEFETMYAKNNGGWEKAASSTMDERKRFADLFIKYKLKLLEARNRGLLQDSAIQAELQSYRSSLALSYMLEKELVEPGLRRLHARKSEEMRASHILIRLPQDASPTDTAAAYQKALSIIAMARSVPFDSLARLHSQDQSVQLNNGDLGWFSQGRMVSEFEDGVYSLKPGEISPLPIRSQFGYHIIKLMDRQPSKGSVRVSHILRKFDDNHPDTAAVRDTVETILRKIRNNEISFAEAASRFSDDVSSKGRGGDLNFYERGGLPPEISSVFFSTPVGSIATYRAPYGYHLFLITEAKPPLSFAETERELRQQYQQMYYPRDYYDFTQQLVRRFQLSMNVSLRYYLEHSFPDSITAQDPRWSAGLTPWLSQSLFSYSNRVFTVNDFISHVNNSEEFRSMPLTSQNVENIIERIATTKLLEEHASTVGIRVPAFDTLMREYESGTLIYRIDQDEIWNKIEATDSLLHQYYQNNPHRFRWPLRVKMAEIFVRSPKLADSLHHVLRSGADFSSLAARFTERPGMKEKGGEWNFLSPQTNNLTKMTAAMSDDSIAAPVSFEGGWSIVKRISEQAPSDKTFEEALPEIMSQYRDIAAKQREQEWIDSLKKKYGVQINDAVLQEAFSRKPGE